MYFQQEGENCEAPWPLEVNLQEFVTAVNEMPQSTTKDDMFREIAKASTAGGGQFCSTSGNDAADIQEILAECLNGEHFISEVAKRAGVTVHLVQPSKGKRKRNARKHVKAKDSRTRNPSTLERGK